MGQYFVLTAPHLRERLDWSGKLGEILFDGSAQSIVYLFARPVIPLPTVRTKDCNERKLGSSSSHNEPSISTLSSREHVISDLPVTGDKSSPVNLQRLSPELLTLPLELHDLIFSFLDIQDIFHLGLTSQYFWLIAKPMITKFFYEVLGVWAGTPVICVGDETAVDSNTYPRGLLTSDDEDELQQGRDFDEVDDWDSSDLNVYPGHPFNLYELAHLRYDIPDEVRHNCPDLSPIFIDKGPRPRDVLSVIYPKPSSFYPTDRSWILRNLTTQEFVTSQAIALKPEYIHGPFIDILGFGEVILSRVCWSRNEFVSMAYSGGIHQGVWAGHQLDIVPFDTLDNPSSWKDISDEVSQEIAKIWKSEYGDDWRDKLMENDWREKLAVSNAGEMQSYS